MFSIPILGKLKAQNLYHDLFVSETKNEHFTKNTFEFNNVNFIKNYEGFNKFYEGYTLLGYFVQPKFHFKIGEKAQLTGGVHILKYFGTEKFTELKPIFTASIKLNEKAFLKLGSINNRLEHDMLDPIYHEELFLTNNTEDGIQFEYFGNKFISDTWIDWEQFIFHGSPYPEKITFGSNNTFSFIDTEKNKLSAKFQILAAHTGGQIDSSAVSVSTFVNSAIGLEYNLQKSKSLKLFAYYLPSADMSPQKKLKYLYGYGIFSGIQFGYKQWYFGIKHWYGTCRVGSHENPIYSNLSKETPGYSEDERILLIPHILKKISFGKQIKAGIFADAYFDMLNYNLDYNVSFFVVINIRKGFDFNNINKSTTKLK